MQDLKVRSSGGEKADDLARLVKERAPRLTCSVCGGREFGLLELPDAEARTYLKHEIYQKSYVRGWLADVAGGQPLASLLCLQCGHVEQFAEAVLHGVNREAYGSDPDDR